MDDPTLIGQWATGIWLDLFQPTNTSPSTISGYAIQPSTLGKLNNLVQGCFSGSGYTGAGTTNYQIGPYVTNSELAIIEAMYRVSYYNNLAQATMGIGGATTPWTTIREGDSSISRANGATLGREYREIAKEAAAQLNYLVNTYRSSQGGNIGRSVDYLSPSYPDWSASYVWPS